MLNLRHYAKSIVYGGLDGIVTTFAVVAGAVGGRLGTMAIVIMGFSNLLADGFSMAVGDYLSSTTETQTDSKQALKNALATFLSFNIFGLFPLVSYLLVNRLSVFRGYTFWVACLLVTVALILLGLVKGSITNQGWYKEVFRTVAVGLVATLVAYYIGYLLGGLV
ncbi:VIT1/CCC1 transporter family protein [Streptococcus dentasini]